MNEMAMTLFGATVEKTCEWINELIRETRLPSPERAYGALRAVLHAVRDRVMVDEAVDFGAQLPMLVRGFYYEGWRPTGRPLKYRHKEEFLNQVGALCPWLTESEREPIVRAVFNVIARHVTGGEFQQVVNQLPEDVRGIWKVPP